MQFIYAHILSKLSKGCDDFYICTVQLFFILYQTSEGSTESCNLQDVRSEGQMTISRRSGIACKV